jgi:phospholipase C
MGAPSRRAFLAGTAAAAAGVGFLASLPLDASPPARRPLRSLEDIEHVVILMQENRSLDHYFGTMRGVRGFGDRTALRFRNGRTVFQQPDPNRPDGGVLLPWYANTTRMDSQDLNGNDHSWDGVHTQWALGRNTGFADDGGENADSMAYLTAHDVPFHHALAASFTFCDNYFCSVKGPTSPNRLMHWTGTIDPNGEAGGPAIQNRQDYIPIYRWTTYPERLQQAGISWQVFANDEVGDRFGNDGWVGDFGDNPLWLFRAYHDALTSSDASVHELATRASLRTQWKPNSGLGRDVSHVLAQFLAAVASETLPAVSWIVAPYAYSEHPAARPVDGAAYVQTVLKAIWAKPELWAKTVVLLNYDEHDGFFDHVIPPTAPPGTPDEYVDGAPIGLGPRVPMTVVSPWSRGGWINSEVFDHTSVLRFLELWTGVREPNISAWRRRMCGDLTSCFDLSRADLTLPMLPDTATLRKKADRLDSKLPIPTAPAPGHQHMPVQQPGRRPARPLPYQPYANVTRTTGELTVHLHNLGKSPVQLQVYDRATDADPHRVDVAQGADETVQIVAPSQYDVVVHGPNGFLREFAGANRHRGLEVVVTIAGTRAHPALHIDMENAATSAVTVTLHGVAAQPKRVRFATSGRHRVVVDALTTNQGWYDVSARIDTDPGYLRRFAGHLENSRDSVTG